MGDKHPVKNAAPKHMLNCLRDSIWSKLLNPDRIVKTKILQGKKTGSGNFLLKMALLLGITDQNDTKA